MSRIRGELLVADTPDKLRPATLPEGDADAASPVARRGQRLAWLPLVVLLLGIIVARAMGLRGTYEFEGLRLVLSFTFYTLVSLGALYLMGRSFLATGAPGLLWLECGVVIWSLAGTVGDLCGRDDPNVNVTIFNTAILVAGLFQLGGAIVAMRPQRALQRRPQWLIGGCVVALGLLGLVTWGAMAHWMPVFFVQGQGGTMVRYCVLSAAIGVFALAAGLLYAGERAGRPRFTFWYALALLLLAVGLFGIMIQLSMWSVVNWLARTAQWSGGLYLLVASVSAMREAELPLLPPPRKSPPAGYRYAVAVVLVLAAAAVRLAFLQTMGMRAIFTPFFPAIILAAIYGGRRGGLAATVLSAVVADYIWMEPTGLLRVREPGDLLALAVFGLVGMLMTGIVHAMQRAQLRAIEAEEEARHVSELRRAEEALRLSEQKFAVAFANNPAAIGLTRLEDGTFMEVNETWVQLSGYSRQEAIGHSARSMNIWPNSEAAGRFVQELRDKGTLHGWEQEFRRKSGESFVAQLSAQVLDIGGEKVILSTLLDVTGRKAAVDALRQSELRFRLALSTAPVSVAVQDGDLKYVWAYGQKTARSEEIIGKTDAEIFTAEEAAHLTLLKRRVLEEGIELREQMWLNRPGGRMFLDVCWTPIRDESGKVIGVGSATMDQTPLKLAEEALRVTEARLQAFMEQIPVGVALIGTEGELLISNLTFRRFVPERIPSRDAEQVKRWRTWDRDGQLIERTNWPGARALRGESVVPGMEFLYTDAEGRETWTRVSAVPFRDAGGGIVGIVSVIDDIDSEKRAEAEVARMTALMKEGQEIAHVGSFEYIAATRSTIWSEEEFRIYGLEAAGGSPAYQEMLDKCYLPEDAKVLHETFGRALAAGGVYELEHRIVRPDGSVRWVYDRAHPHFDAQGKLIGYVGATVDITERKQAEQTLRESEEKFATLFQSAPMAMALSDPPDGRLLDVNEAWLELTGFGAKDEVVGKTGPELGLVVHDETRSQLLSEIVLGRAVRNVEMAIQTKSGARRELLANLAPIDIGVRRLILSTLVDVTERKRAEEAIRQHQKTFTELVERAPFGIYIVDSAFRIGQMNEASQKGAFRNVQPIIGRDFSEAMRILWPEPVAAEIIGHFRHTLETGEPYVSPRFVNPRQDADIVESYEWELHRMILPDGQYGVICYYYDSTQLRRAEARLAADLDALTRMHGLSGKAVEASGVEPLLQKAMEIAVAIVHADKGTLQLLEGDRLHIVAHEGHERPFLDFFAAAENVASVCGEATRRGERVIVPDVETSSIFAGTPSLAVLRAAGVRAVQSTPLLTRSGRLLGILTTHWSIPHTPSEHNLWRLDLLVRQVSDLIEQKQAEEALKASEAELRQAQHMAHIGSWTWDARTDQGKASEELLRIFGFDPATQKIPNFADQRGLWYPPEEWDRLKAAVQEAARSGRGYDLEIQALRGGQRIWIQTRSEATRDAGGRIVGLRGTVQDITERKEAEEALRESHERMEKVLEVETVGVMFWDLTTGRMTDANDAFLNLMGYSRREVEAGELTWQKLTPPEYVEVSLAEIKKFQATGRIGPYEKEYLRKDGGRQWLIFAGSSLGGNACVEFCVDISARKAAEAALRASEERLAALYGSMTEGLAVHEVVYAEGRPADYIVTEVNPAFERLTGISREAAMGKKASELYGTGAAPYLEVYARVAAGGLPESFTTYFPPIGKHFSISVFSPARGKFATVFTDITARVEAEAAVRESEEQFRVLTQNLVSAVALVNERGELIIVNKSFLRLFELPEGTDILNLNSRDWGQWKVFGEGGDLLDVEEHPVRKAARTRTAVRDMLVAVQCPGQGARKWVLISAEPILDAQGDLHRLICTYHDITARKQAEEALRQAMDELQRSNKELERFAYIASHDLQEPLRQVVGFGNLLGQRYGNALDEKGREFLQYMIGGSQRMSGLVKGLLEYSRVGRGDTKRVAVAADGALEAALTNLRLAIEESGARVVRGELGRVVVDPVQLGQVFQNLIGNAIKFRKDGVKPEIEVGSRADGEMCTFWVRDNGIGIPGEFHDRVFVIFQRLHGQGKYPGTGIGLTICRKIVEHHGGRIWIESAAGEGSTFYFTLPRAKEGEA